MDQRKSYHPLLWAIILLGLGLLIVFLVMIVGQDSPSPWGEGANEAGPGRSGGSPAQIVSKIDSEDSWEFDSLGSEPVQEKEKMAESYQGIRARVIDAHSNKPVTRATVRLSKHGESKAEVDPARESVRIMRDTQGILRIYGLDHGTYSMTLSAQGYISYTNDNLKVPQKEEYLEFFLSRGTFIEGRVTTHTGEPVAGITVFIKVELESSEDVPPARRAAQTDTQGGFLFGGLPPGRYSLCLNSLHNPLTEVQDIYLSRGGNHYQALMMPPLSTVEFEIVDPASRPIVTAGIKLYEKYGKATYTGKTDRYGKATFRHVQPGDYTLRIYKNTYKYHLEENFKILPGSDIIRISKMLEKE